VNSRSEVIGVNTAIIMPAQGICFATAIDTVKVTVAQLLQHGKVKRAGLGLAGQNIALPRRVVRYHGLAFDSGVMVSAVEPGGPADAAGLTAGDIIVGFGDVPVGGFDDLHRLLTGEQVARRVPLTVLRRYQKRVFDIEPFEAHPRRER
jgi:S1-C subfamily serine protease